MTRLMEVSSFRDKIGEIDVNDVNILLETSLELVTAPIEALLQTRFDYGVYTDVFSPVVIHPHMQSTPLGVRLSSGFVKATEDFKIYTAFTAVDLLTADENTTLNYSLDYDMGALQFIEGVPATHFKIEYTSGLPEADEDDAWEDVDVPLWLRNIALSYARAVYLRMVWIKAQDESKQRKPLEIKLNAPADIELLAQKYIRWFPEYLTPQSSTKAP